MTFENLTIERDGAVAMLWLDRPEKLNALHRALWTRSRPPWPNSTPTPTVRAIMLAGRGKAFCAGIDLLDHAPSMAGGGSLSGRGESAVGKRRAFYDDARGYQQTVSAFANTNKPVIAAVHGACLGAGMDLITACDIRLASADATFSVRETKIAMVADVGTLQRLPRVIGDGPARELIFTGRDIDSTRALAIGLVNDVLPDHESLHARARRSRRRSPPIHRSPCRARSRCSASRSVARSTRRSTTSRCGMRRSCTRRISPRR